MTPVSFGIIQSSIGKSRMTSVSFVKTAEPNEVCRLGHHLGRNGPKRAGLNAASDQTLRVVHSSSEAPRKIFVCFIDVSNKLINVRNFQNRII